MRNPRPKEVRAAALGALLAAALLGCTTDGAPRPHGSGATSPVAPYAAANPPSTPPSTPGALATQQLPTSYGGTPQGPYLPWRLVKIDDATNRIFLSTSNRDCVWPHDVHLHETAARVTITVEGRKAGSPCTAEKATLLGWVTPQEPLRGRIVAHGRDR